MNNFISKKLRLYSLSLLSFCLLGLSTPVEAASQIADHPSQEVTIKSYTHDLLLRTDAVQEGINVVNTFILRFYAAVRATTGSPEQLALAQEVLQTLTPVFSIVFSDGSSQLVATDFASLLTIIETFSSSTTFESSLIGNFSVENYCKDRHGNRSVLFEALEYVVEAAISGPNVLIPALDQISVIETDWRVFQN